MTIVYNPFTDNLDYKGAGGGSGNVVGPGTSTPGDIAIFNGSSGQLLADSGFQTTDFLQLAGGTMTGSLELVGTPTTANEAANKAYVDSISGGAIFKQVVVAGTTSALNATYANGASGVGATLTNAGALAAFALDGVSLALNDRVLIKNQSSQFQNGAYFVSVVGSGAVAWELTRTTDYDQAAEILAGTVFPIMSGTVNANTSWIQSNTVTTVGTDSVFFTQYTYNAATFLQVANNLSDLNSASTARTNLGLGTLAVLNSPVPAINGGTAQTTYTTGDTLYASAANTLSKRAIGSTGDVLTVVGGVPTWQAPSGGTVTSVSGTANRITSTGGATPVIDISASYVGQASITTLGIITTGTWAGTTITATRGGTGFSTYVIGDVLYASSTSALSKLGIGSPGQVLTVTAGVPAWATPTTGTVTSVSGTTNRITSSGGATPAIDISPSYVGQSSITTLGTVTTGTWSATTIAPTKGGTGLVTYSIGDIIYASASNVLSNLAAGSNTQVLTLAGGVPTWATPTTGTVTSVSGTSNRISSTGGATPVIDIDAAYVGQTSITTLGTVGTGTWNATNISLAKGGTNAALTASNGGIFYSTATAGAILAGTATAGQMLQSGATAAPTWSTATYPATAGTSGNLLTSDGTNIVSSAPPAAYALTMTQLEGFLNPADATTYYMTYGTPTQVWGTTAINAGRIWIPKTGTIRAAYGAFGVAGTLGSAQTATVRIRVNDTTNYTITTTAAFTATINPFSNAALSVPVSAGDYIHFTVLTPTWTTNPSTVLFQCSVYVS